MATQPFSLVSIILLESNFQRNWIVSLADENFKNHTDIEVTSTKNPEHLSVIVSLKFTAGVAENVEVKSDIKMVGVFTIPNNNELPLDVFTTVNAPAIIFPFLREHLASLTLKAGINAVLLQPVNFVKHSEEKNIVK